MGEGARLPLGREHVHNGSKRRTSGDATVGEAERMPLGQAHVLGRGKGGASEGAAVGEGERLPVERLVQCNLELE